MLNTMEITLWAKIETKAFQRIRNKKNMREIFLRDLSNVFGISLESAKEQIKIMVREKEEK